MENIQIYKVTELIKEISETLSSKFPDVWLEGEMSNLKESPSGHIYCSLKDENSQIKSVIFKDVGKQLKFSLENGIKVIVHGRINVYKASGEMQLIVDYVEPAGLGALQLAFEQLKEKLSKEGLFDESRKRPIPRIPKKIGVITSPTGAAIRDILKIISRRFSNVHIVIYPVRVQGEGAAEEIAQALDDINEFSGFDVLIVGRGGGSIEDLWSFNEEIVARAIYNSKIPVISAVGHEIDFTIADFVADLRAPTPSAAAELVVQNKEDLVKIVETSKLRLQNAFASIFENVRKTLEFFSSRTIFTQFLDRIYDFQQEVDDIFSQLYKNVKVNLERKNKSLSSVVSQINVLSPLHILERGYSICLKLPEKSLITETSPVKIGDELQIKLYKGSLFCNIHQIDNK
ncbi:MAG: exodeoxyribonuclease VII large subunit [Candidatus Firestonebacteria bacterium]